MHIHADKSPSPLHGIGARAGRNKQQGGYLPWVFYPKIMVAVNRIPRYGSKALSAPTPHGVGAEAEEATKEH